MPPAKRRDVGTLGFVADPGLEAYYQLIRTFLRLGVFDACNDDALTAAELAARCGITAMSVFQTTLDSAVELHLLELSQKR